MKKILIIGGVGVGLLFLLGAFLHIRETSNDHPVTW